MRHSKLIRILKQLDNKELFDFHDFVCSPFFNKNKKCIALLELLLPYAPSFSAEEIDSVQFFKDVFLKKRSLDAAMEKLLRLLEKYLIQLGLEEEEEFSKNLLLEELRKRGERKHYDLVHKQSMEKLNQQKKDNSVFYSIHLIEKSKLRMLYQERSNQEAKALQLKKTVSSFDKYLISDYISLSNTAFNTREFGSDIVMELTEGIVENSKVFAQLGSKELYREEPLIELRLLLRQLLKNGEEIDFVNLFNAIRDKYSFIKKSDVRHFYKFLSNYCTEKIFQGVPSYYKQILDVYISAMETGALIEGKYLAPTRMKNIIIASAKSEQIELAHDLLDRYFNSIDPQYQEVTAAYCKGYLHYSQKEYGIASDYFLECTNMRSLFALDAQSILYKIYYETNEDWAFEIPVASFRVRLSRYKGKYPKSTIEGYINFFRILRQIYRKKEDPNYKKTTEDILVRINKMKYLSDKQWLKEKLKELDKRK